jgi:HPt (histidine-containing phosphotransfer) domain-containing protein
MSDASQARHSTRPIFSRFSDDEEMVELVEFFIRELQHRMHALSRALETGNADELRTLAHQLKGAAGGYGFPEISACAKTLEQQLLSEEAEVSDLRERVEDLIHLCRRASV